MTYLDTLRHQLCGVVAGIPVHHLEQPSTREFTAGPEHLVLGHGSGGLPAAVAHLPRCVADVLDAYADLIDPDEDPDEHAVVVADGLDLTADRLRDVADQLCPDPVAVTAIDFTGWDGLWWARVVKAARRNPLGPGYSPKEHGSIENWLALVIGEYVLVSWPTLLDENPAVATALDGHRDTLDAVGRFAGSLARYAAVAQYPTGYATGGRGEHLNDANLRH